MKLLFLGLSGSGKSTTAPLIGSKYGLQVYEADDEVMLINNNTWPNNDRIIDKGFEQANTKALNLDNLIFVTSWLSKDDFHRFVTSGYKVIEFHADFDVLAARKIARDNSPAEHIQKFEHTYQEFMEYIDDPSIANSIFVSIDSSKLSSEEILGIISQKLQ